jgi:3-oxoacid CoA-transferase subunit A
MSILLSGDFHSSSKGEIFHVTKKSLIKKFGRNKYNNIKYHIILGDGGFMWPGNHEKDKMNYKTLAQRSFPVLCVIGNHEPILGMDNVTEIDIGIGEKVLLVNNKDPFIAYLKRGKVYNIDGIKFLALGGALSIDKGEQILNKTWWPKEYWDDQEKKDVFKLLQTDNIFDIVISHTGPHQINKELFPLQFSTMGIQSFKTFDDEVSFLNDEIHERIEFKEWWCGHWHRDLYYYNIDKKRIYQYLYRTTKIIDKIEGKIIVYNEYAKTVNYESEVKL